jgi:ATP-dependent Lon protease
VAKKVAMEEVDAAVVDTDDIEGYLRSRKYFSDIAQRTEVPGVSTGLAWTPVGGDILFIEASVSRGTGRMLLTGQLGDVMKESAHAALSYVKAHAKDLNIPLDAFRYWDLHIHVPAGAVPKDGPSAGVAMLSALVSIYTQRRVKHTVAMTGEITLRGLVLPVGGIKEKVLAAKRAGIKRVVLPEKNRKDIDEIEGEALKGLIVTYVKRMEKVLDYVLEAKPVEDPVKYFTIPESEKQFENRSNGNTVVTSNPVIN